MFFFGPILVDLHCCPLATLSCLCAVFLSSHCCTFLGLVFSLFSLCCLIMVRVLVSHPVLFLHLSLPFSLSLSLALSCLSTCCGSSRYPLAKQSIAQQELHVAFSARIPPPPSQGRSVQSALFSDLMRAKNTGRLTPV